MLIPSVISSNIKYLCCMEVKIKMLSGLAIIPTLATDGSACYDLSIPDNVIVKKGHNVIPLGFALEIPKGYYAEVRPRSGFSAKGVEGYKFIEYVDRLMTQEQPKRFHCQIEIGTIDSDYRGGVGIILYNYGEEFFLPRKTRLAQMMFKRYETVEFTQVEDMSATERGDGGFGSTGV